MTPAAREGNQERKGAQNGKIPFFSRLQVKYAMSYLAILAVVLVLLNTYPLSPPRTCSSPPSGTP